MPGADGLVYILNMESGLAEPLAHRIVDMGQAVIFRPWNMELDAAKEVEVYGPKIRGLIISGSAKNINSKKHAPPAVPAELIALGVPTLAICYGMQFLAHCLGVPIVRCWEEADAQKRTKEAAKTDRGEQGQVILHRTDGDNPSPLFVGLGEYFPVWMKHNWMLADVPPGWRLTARTAKCPIAAIERNNIYALQFHPEPHNSLFGRIIIHNFLSMICDLRTPYF